MMEIEGGDIRYCLDCGEKVVPEQRIKILLASVQRVDRCPKCGGRKMKSVGKT